MKKIKVILAPGASSFYDPMQAEGSQKVYPGQIVEVEKTLRVSHFLKADGLLLANAENLEKAGVPDPSTKEGQAEIERRAEAEETLKGKLTASNALPVATPGFDFKAAQAENENHEARESAANAVHEANQSGLELEKAKAESLDKELEVLRLRLELQKGETKTAEAEGSETAKDKKAKDKDKPADQV